VHSLQHGTTKVFEPGTFASLLSSGLPRDAFGNPHYLYALTDENFLRQTYARRTTASFSDTGMVGCRTEPKTYENSRASI
jgi:hypothetical protein